MSIRNSTQHIFSGVCICGHKYSRHHGNVIMRQSTADAVKSGTLYSECEALGVNEGWEPCPACPIGFIDKDDPLAKQKLAEYGH